MKKRPKFVRKKSKLPKSKVIQSNVGSNFVKEEVGDNNNNNNNDNKGSPLKAVSGPVDSDKKVRIFKIPTGRYQTATDVIRAFGYTLQTQLDRGGFGVIYIAYDNRKKIKVACKEIDLGIESNNPQMLDTKNELLILEKVRHPYVIRVYCHFVVMGEGKNLMYIFMELATGGNFYKFLQKRQTIMTETEAKPYFAQILCGINHMHGLGIAHRDIKLQNILLVESSQSITKDYLLVVTDFGLSTLARTEGGEVQLNRTVCGTPAFMAPEILARKQYNAFAADIWALGITLYMMVSMELPFNYRNPRQKLLADMLNQRWTCSARMTSSPSSDFQFVLRSMLDPNPDTRITLPKLIANRWITIDYFEAHAVSDAMKNA